MKYLMEQQARIWPRLKGKKIYLLLDYDGTLTAIAPNPAQAVLAQKTREILKKLAVHSRCVLAIISGRSLANLKKMLHIPKIIYSGNHGLEVDYCGVLVPLFEDASFHVLLQKIYTELRQKMKGIKGVLLENKKMTLSLHYRLADNRQIPKIKSFFQETIQPYQASRQILVTSGKMVLEIRPPIKWGKGELVRWLLPDINRKKQDRAVFYFGDDTTDEDAFRVLKGKGFTVLVGRKKRSAAEYYLRNSEEVREILNKIWHELEVTK